MASAGREGCVCVIGSVGGAAEVRLGGGKAVNSRKGQVHPVDWLDGQVRWVGL